MALQSPIMAPAAPAYPWRRTLRTVLAAVPSALAVWPLIVQALDVPPGPVAGFLVITVAVTAALTRVLAIPAVEAFFQRNATVLAANDVARDEAVAIDTVAAVLNTSGEIVAGPASIIDDGEPVAVVAKPMHAA